MSVEQVHNQPKVIKTFSGQRQLAMDPHKFALWLFLVTVTMLFAAFTSAYIVKQSAGSWRTFELPGIFLWNTGILLVSSLTLHLAYGYAKKDNLKLLRIGMVATVILGTLFLVLQIIGWEQLVAMNVFFAGGNASESFIYIFSGLHGIHLVSGVVFLIVVLVNSFNYKVHSRNMKTMDMCVTYWHYLDGLWLYLYIFLILNN